MKSAALWLSLVLVTIPVTTSAQSAGTVIERYITAIGGKKALENVVSTEMSGRVTAADGRSGAFSQRSGRPNLFHVSLSWGDSRWRTGFNGRSAWQDDNVEGWRTLYGPAASRVRAEAAYASTRFVMSEKANRVSVTGRDQVRGRPVIVILAIAPDGTQRTLFFDAASALLVKVDQQTDEGVEERFFDDYRPVDRVMEPHRIEWHRKGEVFRIAVERVTHNTPLDERLFDVPAPPEPPLDLDAVLAATARREQQAETVRMAYVYTLTTAFGRMDPHGRVTPREGPSLEVFHLGGRPVARLIRKQEGVPLSAAERRREDERVHALVREDERQRTTGQAGRREPAGRLMASAVLVGTPLVGTDWFQALHRMSAFSHVRREPLRARPVIAVEFRPRPGVAPNTDGERMVNHLAGTLWIDEASQQAIRLEAHLSGDSEREIAGSGLRVERTLVNDEVWLPARTEMNLRRSYAFGSFSQHVTTISYTDHKKFTVETDSAVTLPDQGR